MWDYVWALVWFELCNVAGIFLLFIPMDYWFAIFAGDKWDNIFNVIWYYIPGGSMIVKLFGLEVEGGWKMM